MICKDMIKFRSKFQLQILLQFYRTAEKVTKIKLVMVESFDKYQHSFNLHFFVTALFFHDGDSSILSIKVL